jgi:cysteine desulfurase
MAIYLDNNATTEVDPRVIDAMLPYFFDVFGNPSSKHAAGDRAQSAVRTARAEVQALIGARDPQEIVFTSGGTESISTAILSALESNPSRRTIVTSAVEHAAVLSLCEWLRKTKGVLVDVIPVDANGALDVAAYEAALTEDVALVSLMWANNETGVIFPVVELARKAKVVGALFHVDAVQAVGKIAIDVKATEIDMLSLSGHKLHAPKGTGALYVRRGVRFEPLIRGGRQERGRRGGTENVPGIVGLGAASRLAAEALARDEARIGALRDRLESELVRRVGCCVVAGAKEARIANTSDIVFEGVEAEDVVLLLDKAGLCVSPGAACSAGAFEPSHVLLAMGVSKDVVRGGIRFSLSRNTTEAEIDAAIAIVPDVIARLRDAAPAVLLAEDAPDVRDAAHA